MSSTEANISSILARQGKEIVDKTNDLRFVQRIASDMDAGVRHNKVSATKTAAQFGITNPNEIKELVELAVVIQARDIINRRRFDTEMVFNALVSLYNSQMNLTHRTSQSVLLQQYSTPAPISYLAGLFAISGQPEKWVGLEPSAGNGLLTIAGPVNHWVVNEVDDFRRSNLRTMGYKDVFSLDASQENNLRALGFRNGPFDVMVTNPPFGKISDEIVPAKSPQGKTTKFHIKSLEHLMAIHALSQLKDSGSASVIVGGHTRFEGGRVRTGKDLVFLYYLYSNYNVRDVIPIDGKSLYSRQGTGYDTRLILIDGRKPHDPTSFPRLYDPALDVPVKDFSVLYDRVMDAINHKQSTTTISTPSTTPQNDDFEMNILLAEAEAQAMLMKLKLNGLGELGFPYQPAAIACDVLDVETPDAMAFDMKTALDDLKAQVGDVTGFVTERLDYASKDELCAALAAEQIDSVALAILNIERHNQGIIIGDQTGIGKGRQAAAMIRYAVKQGMVPIFLTEKPNLFTDLYRDLVAIGSDDLTPYIMNALDAKTKIQDATGKVVHKPYPKEEQDRYIKEKRLPNDANFIMATYSQLSVGHSRKRDGSLDKMSDKGQFLLKFAADSIIVLDESHNAAGESLVGEVMRTLVGSSKGTVYLSATFAKRPDNMPLYGLKTVLNEALISPDAMEVAFQRGGVALQEVVSSQLVRFGQMIRRQRSFEGIEVNYITLDATAPKQGMQDKSREHRAVANVFTNMIRRIIDFQREHVNGAIDRQDKNMKQAYGTATKEAGTKDAGVDNMPYFSRVFNVINQLLFAIKAEDVADRAIQRLREGKKPVIAFSSTMGSFVEDLLNDDSNNSEIDGNVVINADFSSILHRALDSVMKYRVRYPSGETAGAMFDPDELSTAGSNEYYAIKNEIYSLNTGLVVSPVDLIKQRIEDAGFKVAEVTGRNYEVRLSKAILPDKPSSGERPLRISDIPADVRKIMPDFQQKAIVGSEEHWDILKELDENAKLAKKQFRETVNTDDHKVALHYFYGGSDWYITGWDGKDTLYGYAILNGDTQMGEWGYTSLSELNSVRNKFGGGVELDFFWDTIPASTGSGAEVRRYFYEKDLVADSLSGLGDDASGDLQWVGSIHRRKKENAADAFRKFQDNEVDVLMINQAGATGASAHAIPTKKVPAAKVKQRVMIVLQAELDINKEIQKRGRINRTGQIHKPIYDYVISDIPAEARLMMMLQRKLKSLDANTTSNQKNSEELLKSDDFLNKYGNKIVLDYLVENAKFTKAIDMTKSEADELTEESVDDSSDLAYKVAGRVAILDTEQQEDFYKKVVSQYQEYVKTLLDRGEYDLEMETLNLQARTISKAPLIVGRGGRSSFGDNTYIEECEVNNLRKPFRADELVNILREATKGVPLAEFRGDLHNQQILETLVEPDFSKRLQEGSEKLRAKLQTQIEEIPLLMEYASKTDDENRQKFITEKTSSYTKSAEVQLKYLNDKVEFERKVAKSVFEYFTIGKAVQVSLTGDGKTVMGVVIGIKVKKDNPSRPKNIQVEIAVPSSFKINVRDLYLPNALMSIKGYGPLPDFKNEDDLIRRWTAATQQRLSNREIRYIITGNILQAFSSTEANLFGSKLVDYTTHDNKRKKGILMWEGYKPKSAEGKDGTINIPIYKALPLVKAMPLNKTYASVDGLLSIAKPRYDSYKLIVPKSRSQGGKIFTDTMLLEYMDGENFNSVSNSMVATFSDTDLGAVLNILQDIHNVAITVSQSEFDRIASDIMEADKGIDEVADPVPPQTAVQPGTAETAEADDDLEFMLMLAEAEAQAMLMKLKLA